MYVVHYARRNLYLGPTYSSLGTSVVLHFKYKACRFSVFDAANFFACSVRVWRVFLCKHFVLLEQDYKIVTEFIHGPARIQFDQVQYKSLSPN